MADLMGLYEAGYLKAKENSLSGIQDKFKETISTSGHSACIICTAMFRP